MIIEKFPIHYYSHYIRSFRSFEYNLSICLREGESERFLVEGRSGHSAIAFSMARNNQMNYVISVIITTRHGSIIRWFIRVQCARVHDKNVILSLQGTSVCLFG